MSYYDREGVFNPAYHDSDTLELDRSYSRRNNHQNPYDWNKEHRQDDTVPTDRMPLCENDNDWSRGQRSQRSWRTPVSMPLEPVSAANVNQGWMHEHNDNQFSTDLATEHSMSILGQRPSGTSQMGSSMRRRGTLKSNLFPGGNAGLGKLGLTEEDLRDEIENEEQDLVKELVAMSPRERMQAIQDLPICLEDKKNIRNQVLAFRSSKKGICFTCCTDCSEQVNLSLRRFRTGVATASRVILLWQGTMKEIGGKFGTSVLSYFSFLKWLLMFNVFSFLVNFGFITIPQLLLPSQKTDNVSFRGLELITGAGYFGQTVMYYGGYSNETISRDPPYNMQLAYFFTIAVYLLLCGVSLIYSMASSFRTNFVLSASTSGSAWRLLCSWDFNVFHEKAVRQRKNNLRVQLKESLSETSQRNTLPVSERMKQFGVYLVTWVLSLGLAAGACAAIYYLCQYNLKQTSGLSDPGSVKDEASTLLLPFVVSLFNLVIPLLTSLLSHAEQYSSPRTHVYIIILRNVFFKMSVLGVLCYHWMNNVTKSISSCWESYVGQDLYRLVVIDFLFLIFGSFFREFLCRIIGTKCIPRLGIPEFNIATNVLDLIYAQSLAWIGIYFSPLLPAIQIIKFFFLFYLKKISLNRNCQPPRRYGRAAQMQTIFIALLFFPFFVGAVSMVAYTVWRLTPSDKCGPFRGLNTTFDAVSNWIDGIANINPATWIYQYMIKSELFFFLLALIILVLIYLFWQVIQGRKLLIILLKEQIINVGKDKTFLLDKLRNLQKVKHSSASRQPENVHKPMYFDMMQQIEPDYEEAYQSHAWHDGNTSAPASSALVQAMLARQQAEKEEEY